MATLADPPTSPSETGITSSVELPLNLNAWIEENRHLFKPPVSNRYVYDGRDFFVMVIMGPNARNDFHQVDSEEFFFQLKGDIKVRIREGDRIVDHLVREGETFFIPPNVPHAPVRPPDTIGMVVERRRPPGEREHVIFYCPNCEALVEDIDFDCADIVQAFSQAMLDFWADDARRTCKSCGTKVEKAQPVKPF
jgi:3-hydroxyanthranilate 3,4-dioxygenase